MKHNKQLDNDPYLSRCYTNRASKPSQYPKSVSQSLPFYICDEIFQTITYAEINAQANRDYTVIQLDYFPHSPLASVSRSQLYKVARKP